MKKTHFITFAGLFAMVMSFDVTAEWQRTNDLNGEIINALIANGKDLFAGTRDSGVFRSNDSGESWLKADNGLMSLNVQALAINGTDLFAGTHDGGVFRSEDSGATWHAMNTGISTLNIQALAVNDTYLFAGTNGGGVCRSSDSGTHWLEVSNGLGFNNVYSIGISSLYVFAGTWGSSAFRSADNGMNWYLVTNGLADPRANIIPYCFAMGDTFIFTGTGGAGVFRARDSARVWFPMNNGLPDSASVGALALSGEKLFAATQQGVFCSIDNGDNWVAVNNGLIDTIVHSFTVSGTNLFAGTRNGVWKLPLTGLITEVKESPIEPPDSFALEQNSPNPFNPTTTIRYKIPANSLVSLKAYDSRGKEVVGLVNEIKSPGTYSAHFDASALASGLYFYRLNAGGYVKAKVMLLVR